MNPATLRAAATAATIVGALVVLHVRGRAPAPTKIVTPPPVAVPSPAEANRATSATDEPSEAASADLRYAIDGALQAVLSDRGDVPGSDTGILPRPAGTQRLLTTRFDDHGADLRVYETTRAAHSVADELDTAARARGLARVDSGAPATLAFASRDVLALVRFTDNDGVTLVSLVEVPLARAGAGEGRTL